MIDHLIGILEEFRSTVPQVEAVGVKLAECLDGGGTLLSCGNGGSASDAMHLCEELTGRYSITRSALPAICLNSDGTALTCIANDFGYEEVFARQVEAFGNDGDFLVGFSTSGNSENVLRAFRKGKEKGMKTVLLGGANGGQAASIVDYSVVVPSDSSSRVQEVHTWVLHRWIEIIEQRLFGINCG